LRSGFMKAYMALLVIAGIVAWWLVLAHKSRQVAQEESNRQTHLLMREIESHRQTDEALQQARLVADEARHHADQANQAKSRYISAISHELRTPLNSILGYAQLMGEDSAMPPHRKQAVSVIKRGGEHLLSLIEGTLDIARIEAGKLTLNVKPMHFADCVHEMAGMFELQAAARAWLSASRPAVIARGGARRRKARAPDPDQPAGQCHQVHRAGPGDLQACARARDGLHRHRGHRPRHARTELAQIFEPFARGAKRAKALKARPARAWA
jgi:signal transduction histidine kinase